MDIRSVLDRYDREMRARPYLPPELTAREDVGVLCVTGQYNCVIHTALTEANAEAAIDAQLAAFAARGEDVEWKVHAHDRPADLGQRLASRGFEPDPAETLMALSLANGPAAAPKVRGIEVRQVLDAAGLRDFVDALTAGFEADRSDAFGEFEHRLGDPTVALYVAYAGEAPVGAGRVDLPPERPFAGLYAGAVAPTFRRRGVYRALVDARLSAARTAGYDFAMVEALPTSR
ncbi:MAG: acetyltransferase, partial [Caulobacteraceae bacterium]|nr:acetyltransferase [Caulobacteraceae bacterium]